VFHFCIEEATEAKGPFPYKSKDDFDVEGLPAGIPFRKPSGYGACQLKSILQCKDEIEFTRKENGNISTLATVQPSTTQTPEPPVTREPPMTQEPPITQEPAITHP
jgi:hypothetical protein